MPVSSFLYIALIFYAEIYPHYIIVHVFFLLEMVNMMNMMTFHRAMTAAWISYLLHLQTIVFR